MVFLYATNATELCIGLDIGAVQGLLVDIITFGSFRRCLVAYKYTMLTMFQARYTPIETINTAASIFLTEISSTDAALRRGIASLANHTIISRTNARLSFNTDKGILKASKNIRNGQEILVNYGADYRFQDSVHTTKYFPPP